MDTRDANQASRDLSVTNGHLVRIETGPDAAVPSETPSVKPAGKRTKPSGAPINSVQALEALTAALTTLSAQLERERVRADQAEAALVEARAAVLAATEETATLRQEIRQRRSAAFLTRLGRVMKAWEGE